MRLNGFKVKVSKLTCVPSDIFLVLTALYPAAKRGCSRNISDFITGRHINGFVNNDVPDIKRTTLTKINFSIFGTVSFRMSYLKQKIFFLKKKNTFKGY